MFVNGYREKFFYIFFIGGRDPTSIPFIEVLAALGASVALIILLICALVFTCLKFVRRKQECQQAAAQNNPVYEEPNDVGFRNNRHVSAKAAPQVHLKYEEPDTISLRQRREMERTNVGLSARAYQNMTSARPARCL